jgi:hypothetical protein
MKDRRIDRVVDHHWIAQLEAELTMLGEAVRGLQDRRVGELLVDPQDAAVGTVVEAAVRADRAVDPVHHANTIAREPFQPAEVEVERVVEARLRPAREPVHLHLEPAAFQLAHEGEQKLIAPSIRRGRELVEDGEIGVRTTRAQPIRLGATAPSKGADRPRHLAQGPSCKRPQSASFRHVKNSCEGLFHAVTV